MDQSYGIALAGAEDRNIQNHFIENAVPPKEKVDEVLDTLAAGAGLSTWNP